MGPQEPVSLADPAPPRAVGRPRDPGRDTAILDAVVQLLADRGYAHLRLDDVAAAAGSSKATIYRRWEGKEQLVVAALTRAAEQSVPLPDTGSLRHDLITLLTAIGDALGGPLGAVLVTLLAQARTDTVLQHLLQDGFVIPRQQECRGLFARARDRGEVPAAVDLDALAGVPFALLFAHAFLSGRHVHHTDVIRLVDTLVLPLATSPTIATAATGKQLGTAEDPRRPG